jgi:ubiquinone/menaquinone biosynthesis C-methylase UbiE
LTASDVFEVTSPVIEGTNTDFWALFYSKDCHLKLPSNFAKWCLLNYFNNRSKVLELGCGNGRDTFYFLENKIPTIGLDGCSVAIRQNNHRQQNNYFGRIVSFHKLLFNDLVNIEPTFTAPEGINLIYSRFFLHAITEAEEMRVLDFCDSVLASGGLMCHEFRTTNDPLMNKGTLLSAYERHTDHYRRFIDTSQFRKKLNQRGWKERYFIEAKNLAIFGDENPVVARVVFVKS